MIGHSYTLPGTCGLSCFYEFGSSDYGNPISSLSLGGIGYSVAGFVNNRACKTAYEEIKEHYEIVFQSPVKRNRNSGNQFFFIVFKRKES